MKSRPLMFSTISRRRHRFRSIGLALSMFYVALSSSYLVVGCDSYTANPPSKQHSSSGYTIQPMTWEYKSRYDIGYEVATPTAGEKDNDNDQEHPILLLNGFGVGSFHQHRLIAELLKDYEENDSKSGLPKRTVYCLDYLGQGRSWPKDCRDGTSEDEKDLQYSANTWCEQIIDFIEQVVEGNNKNDVKVHLVGNSVGGHLAAHVAQRRPDLVASICLLNPTPVWGSKLPGWNGHLPAPAIPKAVGRYLFDQIRDLNTIDKFLEATYSVKEAYTEELMHQIRGATLGNGGHAAFASIMWSPPLQSEGSTDFGDCLRRIPSGMDVFLVFGQDDPWCKPAFARNMLRALEERPGSSNNPRQKSVHRYVQITNAGHCPNHEAPKAVGHLVRTWVDAKNDDRRKEKLSFVTGNGKKNIFGVKANSGLSKELSFVEDWAEHTVTELDRDDIPLNLMDRIITTFL